MKSYLKNILLGIRPPTLLVGISPVLVGSAYGYHFQSLQGISEKNWQVFMLLIALLLVILMQSAANLVNDVKDAESGIDQAATRLGPVRIVAAGLLEAKVVRQTYYSFFAIAMLLCLGLVWYGGWSVVGLGALCCLFAYLYTGGPKPLSHLGLGEVVAVIFFGPVAVAGSAFLQSSQWLSEAWLIGFGPGLIAGTVMAINNARDRQGDREAGKVTLATKLSARGAVVLPWILVLLSLAVFLITVVQIKKGSSVGFMILICLTVLAIRMIKPCLKGEATLLNQALKRTSIWDFLYACALGGVLLL